MHDPVYLQRVAEKRSFVESGCVLILVEPEFDDDGAQTILVTGQVDLTVVRKADIDRSVMVRTCSRMTVSARCGLKLSVAALFEISLGAGKVIVCRFAGDRSRAANRISCMRERLDPVLHQYLLNLFFHSVQDHLGRITR